MRSAQRPEHRLHCARQQKYSKEHSFTSLPTGQIQPAHRLGLIEQTHHDFSLPSNVPIVNTAHFTFEATIRLFTFDVDGTPAINITTDQYRAGVVKSNFKSPTFWNFITASVNIFINSRGEMKLSKFVAYQNHPSKLRTALYYCHRVVGNSLLRAFVVRALGLWIGKRAGISGNPAPLIPLLREDGIVQLGEVLSEIQCAEILEYLSDKPVYDKDMYVERAFSDTQSSDMAYGIHLLQNVVDCPHIMELVSSPKIVQLAAEYLGCNPTLSCLGVQWSFPTNTARIAQRFHRDAEDWKYLRFIVYLTDVNHGCGPHVYVKGSHQGNLPFRMKFYPVEEISQRYGKGAFIKVLGRRGTGIAADTSGIHKGELPTEKPRLMLTFTYAILPNILAEYAPVKSRHSPQLINYTNRLFLR